MTKLKNCWVGVKHQSLTQLLLDTERTFHTSKWIKVNSLVEVVAAKIGSLLFPRLREQQQNWTGKSHLNVTTYAMLLDVNVSTKKKINKKKEATNAHTNFN